MNSQPKQSTDDAMGKGSDTDVTILPTTRVPIGVAVASVIAACGFTFAHFSMLYEVKSKLSSVEAVVHRMEPEMWTRQNQEIFALRLRNMNPTITVPDTRDINARH